MFNGLYGVLRGGSVGIETGYRLDDRSSPGTVKNFHFSTSSTPPLGSTEPSIPRVPGAFSPGVKLQGREIDQSPLTSANVALYIHFPTRLHGVVLS
jgi:hypothetical protein